MAQAFGQFHADKSAAHHNDALGAGIEFLGNAVHVFKRPQRQHFGQVHAGELQRHGRGAGSENQLVVVLFAFDTGFAVEDADGLLGAVNGGDFVEHAHIHIEACAEVFGGHHQQPATLRDDFAEVIGQATVGIGNVRAAFEQDNFRFFIHAPQSGGRAGTGGYAANNDRFHNPLILVTK